MKKFLIFFVLITSHLSSFANGVNLSCALDQSSCDRCPEYQTIFPVEKFSENTGALDIEADQSEIIEDKYLLSGNVEANSQNLFLSANDVEVSSTDSSILATGNVKFQDESYLITSDYLSAARDDENLVATATNANYQDYSAGIRGANGYTEIIEKTPKKVLLTNSTYSLCPVNENDWLIDADQIELNLEKNRGVADNATVKFYGVPIFYTPKYSWVLSGRGSGFLTPDYSTYNETGQNDSSYSIRVPYYLNLAPDRDLLIALTYMSSRRFIYEGKYRQLIAPPISSEHKDSIWSIEAKYLPEDKITSLKRWLIDFSNEFDLTDKVHLSARYFRVSDRNYFRDIARSNTNVNTLKSHFKINFKDKKNNLSAEILTENEQAVNSGTTGYTRAIEAGVSKTFNESKKVPVNTLLVGTKFVNDDQTKEVGLRLHTDISASTNLSIKYPLITPRAGVSVTNYSLKNSPDINRTIFGAGINFDFGVNRNSSLFGYKTNHKISPIVSYNYRGKKVRSNIPIFDTEDKYDDIMTFSELTSGERYTGFDRITNANDITLSLESTHRQNNALVTDNDLLSLKVAQSYYTDDEVVSDAANTNYETRRSYSDIAASVDFALHDYTFNSSLQFDPDSSKLTKKENKFSYSPSSRRFISFTFTDKGSETNDKVFGAYPLSKNVHFFGGLDKTTSTTVSKTETTGLAYESCCWAFRVAHFKEGNASSGYSYSTGMELVLTGLGSTSSPLKGRIEGNIPGYEANLR